MTASMATAMVAERRRWKDAEIAAIGGGGKTAGRHGDVGEMTGGVGDGERGRIGTSNQQQGGDSGGRGEGE